MQYPKINLSEAAEYMYKNLSYESENKMLQYLRQDKSFCDIQLKTVDGGAIFGHKVILSSASSYFKAMFTNLAEKNQDTITIEGLNSTTLRLITDFIYSGLICITPQNVEVLLPAAILLQLQNIIKACCDVLQAQLCLANCISTYVFADLHSCTELITSSKLYIQQNFSCVVERYEFLSISLEQLVRLISSEELIVLSKAKVVESATRWVQHDLKSRNHILPKLMSHIQHLSSTSKN